jgi:hypothetical protein
MVHHTRGTLIPSRTIFIYEKKNIPFEVGKCPGKGGGGEWFQSIGPLNCKKRF